MTAVKPPSFQKTIAIPRTLSHTKRLVEEKAKTEASAALLPKDEEKKDVSEAQAPLTQEKLDEAHHKVLAYFKSQEKNMEVAILSQPMKVEKNEVVLEVMGHVQEELANKIKPDLVAIIRKLTGAGRFGIRIAVTEEMESTKSKLYTSTDKLNFLKQKHGALAEFQRRFGLETDF